MILVAGCFELCEQAVKRRKGSHENTIRELKIGPEGIEIGEALRQFQGILGGAPVFTGTASQLIRTPDDKSQGTSQESIAR